MKIAVFSDTHDNIWNIDDALPMVVDAGAIIHCGDLCSPFVVDRFGKAAQGRPVHIVWGNNDGDIQLLSQVASKFSEIKLHGLLAEFEVDHLRIAVNHYPKIARGMALTGQYDLVCYGHDHITHISQIGECSLLNPGELMGMKGVPTFALFNTETMEAEFIRLDGAGPLKER
jgi:putative phosphoesterase